LMIGPTRHWPLTAGHEIGFFTTACSSSLVMAQACFIFGIAVNFENL